MVRRVDERLASWFLFSAIVACGVGLASCNGPRNSAKKYLAELAGTAPNSNDAPLTGTPAQPDASGLPANAGPVACSNHIYALDGNNKSIFVLAGSATGSVPPLRTISGASTGLSSLSGIAFDVTSNEVLVTSNGILAFAKGASGNATPLRTISTPAGCGAIAVDIVNDEIDALCSPDSIVVFPRTGSGNVAPLRTISGASTAASAIAVDTVNNEFVVVDAVANSVSVFARTASGNVAPLRTISGTLTQLSNLYGVAVDTVNNEIIVSNYNPYKISFFSRTATGNVAPLRIISGSATQLLGPGAITLDPVNNEIYVANSNGGSGQSIILVFARTASGNVAPLRGIVISNPSSTQPSRPSAVALDQITSCSSGNVCASGGCIPTGSVDCNDGTYCAAGLSCASSSGPSTCVVLNGGTACPNGSICAAGETCATMGCLPPGAKDCGNGYHCTTGTCTQSAGQTVCITLNNDDMGTHMPCSDGSYCPTGTTCASSVGCLPTGSVDCNNGYYCAAGTACAQSNGQTVCNPIVVGGGPGGGSCDAFGQQYCNPTNGARCYNGHCQCCWPVCGSGGGACTCLGCDSACSGSGYACSSDSICLEVPPMTAVGPACSN